MQELALLKHNCDPTKPQTQYVNQVLVWDEQRAGQCSLPQPPSPAIHFHLLFLDDFVFLQKKCMGKGFHLRSHYSVKRKNAADAEAGSEEKMFCAPGVWKGAAVAGQGSRAEMQQRFPSHHGLGGVSRWGPTGKGPAAKVGCFCGPTLPRGQAHKCLAF